MGKPVKPGKPIKPGPRDPATEACEAIIGLWMSGKPIFPQVAREFGLMPQEMHMLRLLSENESLPQRAFAELLWCDASYVTAIVDKMEERGLIERRADPNDRRVKRISITAAGLKLRDEVLARLYEPPLAIKQLSKSDQRALRDIMRRALELRDASDG